MSARSPKLWTAGQRVMSPKHMDRVGTIVEFGPNQKRPWAWVEFDDAPAERLSVWLSDLRAVSP